MLFATTYAVFASRRAYDFICLAIAEENLNVKIVCALPGLTTGYGPSHQATDDLAIFRAMPNLTVVDPCDALDIEQAVPAIANHDGPVYMRLLRGNVPLVLDQYDYRFELGKAKLLRDGKDALVISSGFMTMRARGRQYLATPKASMSQSCIRRRSSRWTRRRSSKKRLAHGRLVIVAENHSIIGGLGEAVAACCCSGWLRRSGKSPCRMRSRRRRPADAARPLRHLGRRHGQEHQRVDVRSLSASALPFGSGPIGGSDAIGSRNSVGAHTMTSVGFIGLGSMGLPMAKTWSHAASTSAVSTCGQLQSMSYRRREERARPPPRMRRAGPMLSCSWW